MQDRPAETEIPNDLRNGEVHLLYEKTVDGDARRGLVPYFHFKIVNRKNIVVGHINFRVGDTHHLNFTAGHIGFEILPEFRGNSYALQACRALRPFIQKYYKKILLTVDPSNAPSIRVIENLEAVYVDEVAIPIDDPAYASGMRRKIRYEWDL